MTGLTNPPPWKRIEEIDKEHVIEPGFHTLVHLGRDWKAFGHDSDVGKWRQESTELAYGILTEYGRIEMVDLHLHELVKEIKPGTPVDCHDDGLLSRLEHAMNLADHALRARCEVQYRMAIDEVEAVVR